MLDTLKSIDTSLFLFLNAQHNAFFDQLMWIASGRFTWIPLYILLLWLLYGEHRKRFWLVILTIVLMIVLSDQFCNLAKFTFLRLRPSNEPVLRNLVHLVHGYSGGAYGFYSGHASNSFAVALFAIGMIKRFRNYLIPFMLCFAVLVSYSRIYLGVHYPGDILTGATAGSLIGWGMSRLFLRIGRSMDQKAAIHSES